MKLLRFIINDKFELLSDAKLSEAMTKFKAHLENMHYMIPSKNVVIIAIPSTSSPEFKYSIYQALMKL